MYDEIIEKVKIAYARELRDLGRAPSLSPIHRNYAIQRGLGVAFFVQELGVPFEVIDKIYMDYKNNIDKL